MIVLLTGGIYKAPLSSYCLTVSLKFVSIADEILLNPVNCTEV